MSQQIYKAIPQVMKAVGAIEKGKRNQQQNYAFRGIDDVMGAFQRPLADAGVFYVPEVLEMAHEAVPSKAGGVLNYTRLKVGFTFFAEDGSNVRAVVAGEAMDSADKSTNKAMSAALKYALLQVFCVPTEMEDADEITHAVGVKSTSKPAAQSVKTETPGDLIAKIKQAFLSDSTEADWKQYFKDNNVGAKSVEELRALLARFQPAEQRR